MCIVPSGQNPNDILIKSRRGMAPTEMRLYRCSKSIKYSNINNVLLLLGEA